MVIKKGPDGKYYIAPSPPSFYESKKPGSSSGGSGSSSGGSSLNNFLNIIDKAKQEGQDKLKVIAPDYVAPKKTGRISSGGGTSSRSYNVGGSSSGGGTSTAQQITGALSTSTANTNVYNYKQSQTNLGRLGINQTSNAFTPVVDSWYKDQQSKTGSFNMPSYNIIKKEKERGGISKDTALSAMGTSFSQDYQSKYSQANKQFTQNLFESESKKRDTGLIYYQGRIDKGEDFKTVTGEYDTYIKTSDAKLLTAQKDFGANWEATTGARYKGNVNRIMYDQALIYDTDKAKSKVFSSFTSGAKTGAVTTGAFQVLQKYAPKVASAGSKFIAVPVMVAYAGYAYGSSGYSGYKNYKTAKGLGFTTSQSVQRGLLSGANTLSGPAFFSAGAVTGGLAVSGTTMAYKNLRMTGRVTGYSSAKQGRIDKLLGRKNAFKVDLKKGQVTDAVAKGGGKSITGGTSTRSYSVKLNTKGLGAKDLATAKKFNLRGTVNQQVSGTGGRFTGIEGARFKTGGMFGRTTTSFTNIQGTIKGGKVAGLTTTLSRTGRTSTRSYGAFKGTGSVKAPNVFTRLEGSSTTARTLFSATYTRDPSKLVQFGRPGGRWTGYSAEGGPKRFSKIGIESNLKEINIWGSRAGTVTAKTYGDVAQWYGPEKAPFSITKVPSSRSYNVGGSSSGGGGAIYKTTSGGGGTVQLIKTVTKFKPMAPTSTTNIKVQQYQTIRPGFLSAYAGTGQYEYTQMEGLKTRVGVRGPQAQLLGPQAQLLPQQAKVKEGELLVAVRVGHRHAYQPIVTPPLTQVRVIGAYPRTQQSGKLLTRTQPALISPILTGGYGFGGQVPGRPRPRILPGLPSLPMGAWGQAGFGKIGAKKSRTGYNPSFTASFFKIIGKKPTGTKTGIGFRPIIRRVRRVRK